MDQIDRGVLSVSCPTLACRDERTHLWPVRQRLTQYRIVLITFYAVGKQEEGPCALYGAIQLPPPYHIKEVGYIIQATCMNYVSLHGVPTIM